MSLIPNKCIEFDEKRKICIAVEKGKVYKLNNNSNYKIKKVKVDNCIPNHEEKRCDFLMDIKSIKRVIFIELKGGDLVHALKQILVTINYLKAEFKNYQIAVRIIGSRDVPEFINSPDYVKLEREIYKTRGKILRATNNIYKESI